MYGRSAEATSSGASVVSTQTMVPAKSDGGDARRRVTGAKGLAPMRMERRRRISNQRQHRVQMNTLLESLQALLPEPTPRKDRCSLLIDIVKYIQSLEDKIEELGTCKGEIISSLVEPKAVTKPIDVATLSVPLLKINLKNFHVKLFKLHKGMDGLEEIILTFMSPRMKGIFSHILVLFNINQIEIINATIISNTDNGVLHYIHAQVPKDLDLQSDDLRALFSSSNELTLSEEEKKP